LKGIVNYHSCLAIRDEQYMCSFIISQMNNSLFWVPKFESLFTNEDNATKV